jgi:hypothetical protein
VFSTLLPTLVSLFDARKHTNVQTRNRVARSEKQGPIRAPRLCLQHAVGSRLQDRRELLTSGRAAEVMLAFWCAVHWFANIRLNLQGFLCSLAQHHLRNKAIGNLG